MSKQPANDPWNKIAEGTYLLMKVFSKGVIETLKLARQGNTQFTYPFIGFTIFNGLLLRYYWHLYFIRDHFPNFVLKLALKIFPAGDEGKFKHLVWLFIFETTFFILTQGIKVTMIQRKWQKFFESMGLKNGSGHYPSLIKDIRHDKYSRTILLKSNGIGLGQFVAKKDYFEALLSTHIELIESGKDPSIVKIVINTKQIPTSVDFIAATSHLKMDETEFIVGEDKFKVHTARLCDLPHLLIAGTTGGGKSSFFKQVLATLIQTTPHLQMYLIDLKGGLEFSDFKDAPQVKIAKSVEEAVQILSFIEKQMAIRFSYLEKKRYKSIKPSRDHMDRLIVAVDEASVLYASLDKHDPDHDLMIEAMNITNKISKLGRAAGIHLILATQKVSKETINTSIQENISARMCFRMNTLQGSLAILGDKRGMDLPAIPGRGIWSFGQESFEVQAPYLLDSKIQAICDELKCSAEGGQEFFYGPMMGETKNQENPSKLINLLASENSLHD